MSSDLLKPVLLVVRVEWKQLVIMLLTSATQLSATGGNVVILCNIESWTTVVSFWLLEV